MEGNETGPGRENKALKVRRKNQQPGGRAQEVTADTTVTSFSETPCGPQTCTAGHLNVFYDQKMKKLSHQLFRCTDVILIIRASIMQSRVNNCKVNKSQLRSFSQANFPEWWLRHTALTNLPRLLRFAKKGAAQAAVLRAHSQNACSCKFMSLLISLLLCLLLYWPTKGKRKFALASLTKFKTKNWLHTEISLNVEKAQGRYKSRKNTETKMQKNSETNKVSLCNRGVCGLLN